ncbi:MAG TPA: fluoride efflux transporter CrcB [Chryseosolibacter sp.]
MTFTNILLVGIGGFLGSVARYLSSISIDQRLNSTFPFGTFTVNLAGAFVLGLIYGWASKFTSDSSEVKLFLITGFCGGFTTFSTFAFENFDLVANRMAATSIIYSLSSLVLGVVLVWIGIWITRQM